jgi:uncharacterized protein YndB with AHSA1/START domain
MDDDAATLSAYGVLSEPQTLKFQRLLPGPIERLWAYLTESDLRRRWLAAGKMDLQAGALVELVWRNDELNSPPSQRPAGFPEEQRLRGRIREIDPPRKLAIAWDGGGDVSYQLERKGDDVLLTMSQHGLPNRDILLMFAAGSHMHLELLAACLADSEPPLFWDGWSRLLKEYGTRIVS